MRSFNIMMEYSMKFIILAVPAITLIGVWFYGDFRMRALPSTLTITGIALAVLMVTFSIVSPLLEIAKNTRPPREKAFSVETERSKTVGKPSEETAPQSGSTQQEIYPEYTNVFQAEKLKAQ